MGIGKRQVRLVLGATAIVAAGFPFAAGAQPPDGSCSTTPAESVGRLMDSLSSLISTLSRVLPPPPAPAPPTGLEAARAAVAAKREHTERNGHRLSEELQPALAGQEPTAIVNRRNQIASAMRVEVRMSGAALRELVESGTLRATGTALDLPATHGTLAWSAKAPTARVAQPGAEVVVTLKTDRIHDRALVLTTAGTGGRRFENDILAWDRAPFLVLHRTYVGPRGTPAPEAIVLGAITADDIASISLPSGGGSWSGVESEVSRRLPGVTVTRYE